MAKYDAGAGLSGAASGAATGAMFGPWGAAAGGVIGGAIGLFGSKKKKKKPPGKRSTLDPQQQQLYDDYIASISGEGPYSDLYNFDAEGYNDVFNKSIARPAYRNFKENIIPGITGHFRSKNLGTSSYTGEALSRAGRDVQENLDALRSQNVFSGQQQAKTNKQNSINSILDMQTFAYEQPTPQKPSTIDQILNTVGPAAGDWLADYVKGGGKGGGGGGGNSPTAAGYNQEFRMNPKAMGY